MHNDIKVELLKLSKKQVDLLDEIRKRGYSGLAPSELSRYINGRLLTPQAKAVIEICYQIIDEWKEEQESKKEGEHYNVHEPKAPI